MNSIDFSRIRSFDGSQQNGFEELICQLAHLNKPATATYFVRKEGAGGDAGVECYWKLSDGSEHAWQAKYFLQSMDAGQWQQISNSVETALDKHPNITKYCVCLPRDWTDSRKGNRSGEQVHSAWNKWEEHVEKWESLAKERGMKVEFTYWCKHEISMMLQMDNPYFSGRALYWFNEPVIHNKFLQDIAVKSREALGERYTEENHLDLPIEQELDGLHLSPEWKNRLIKKRKILNNLLKKLTRRFLSFTHIAEKDSWKKLYKELEQIDNELLIAIKHYFGYFNFENINAIYLNVEKYLEECNNHINVSNEWSEEKKLSNQRDELNNEFYNIQAHLMDMKKFFNGKSVKAMNSKSAVLVGEAGIGKSHLLCDISLKRLEKSLPTLFLLGQQYTGGNPLGFIQDQLDIKGVSYKQVLGALDALGEANKTRTLIVIDAINEGPNKSEWNHHISALLTELSRYPHLSIIMSCRSTYTNYILPDISEKRLLHIHHYGFRGYEHRAAMKYLAKQGISKPSTPITAPEFSNPLFLKTCCKALKLNGYTTFPRGLYGQSKLFDFYLSSVAKNINREKRYLQGQKVVENALISFVKLLYPDNLYGASVSEAVKAINKHDTNSQIGDTLINILIDEGILSLEILPDIDSINEKEIIRFTYERFSDHFIAQHIINLINQNDIATHFKEDGMIGNLIKEGPKISGIIEALGIGFPEKLNTEFIDYISKDSFDYQWLFSSSFSDVVLWRAKESFTDRTLQLLNEIPSYGVDKESINILLSLSNEPQHPWNADFLDANLREMGLAQRDAFWSTHVAINDREEDENQAESVVRTLIDWSLFVDLEDVEIERIRLMSIVLLWMTTTTNRKVRDQSTKSLARILYYTPELIPNFILKYKESDDPYLIERLFAAVYGAICNTDNNDVLIEVAELVYKHVFENRNPYPHILMRDYARGILEYAYNKGVLSKDICPNVFRPPYSSEWPIDNPKLEEISALVGDGFSSEIERSVNSMIGDFGKYTMGGVHNWSPTPLSEKHPESTFEIHRKFAESLPGKLKDRYINLLNKKIVKSRSEKFDFEDVLQSIESWFDDSENVNQKEDEEVDDWESLSEEIKSNLDPDKNEYFRWVSGQGINDRPARFSRKWAQRWVCKRAYELGWKEELFEGFERIYARQYDRSTPSIERIGKKYQWIAYHELLARMSDNLHWIDRGYSDVNDDKFWGPWQDHLRDLDPTSWIRETNDSGWDEFQETWWQPFTYSFADDNLKHQQSWLWNKGIIPPFKELLIRENTSDKQKWLVLRGFSKWTKKPEKDENKTPIQDGWFRINTCIIHKNDFEKVKSELKGKNLCDPSVVSPSSTNHQRYLGEYPWHPCYKDMINWTEPDSYLNYQEYISVKYLVPTNQYEWESNSVDKSLNHSLSIYLPNELLINEIGLHSKQDNPGVWLDLEGNPAFMDPSINEKGPSYALMRLDLIFDWLHENDFQLIWLIGGEKQLFTNMANEFYGRLVYSGIYTISDMDIDGEMWFIEEPGENN